MEKRHDRHENRLLALAALAALLLACLLILYGLRTRRGSSAYADAVLVAAQSEVQRHEA